MERKKQQQNTPSPEAPTLSNEKKKVKTGGHSQVSLVASPYAEANMGTPIMDQTLPVGPALPTTSSRRGLSLKLDPLLLAHELGQADSIHPRLIHKMGTGQNGHHSPGRFEKAITDVVGDEASARTLIPQLTVEIKDITSTSTKEEVEEAIKKTLAEGRPENMEVWLSPTALRGTRQHGATNVFATYIAHPATKGPTGRGFPGSTEKRSP